MLACRWAQATIQATLQNAGVAQWDRVRVWSYLDDFVIAVPPAWVARSITITVECLAPTGYIPAWDKLLVCAKDLVDARGTTHWRRLDMSQL